MAHLVWLIGALIIAWGLTAVFKPELIKGAVKFFSAGKRYLLAAFIRLLLAIVFLVLAFQTPHPRLILGLGLLFLVGGILLLVLPAGKRRAILTWWGTKPVWVFRLIGVAVVLFGAIVIWGGWPL